LVRDINLTFQNSGESTCRAKEDIQLATRKRVWVKLNVAEGVTGFSRSTLLRLIANPKNKIRTYLHKSRPDAQSGTRLVYLPSLLAYFNRAAKQARPNSLG
jgi:hypothetical protein